MVSSREENQLIFNKKLSSVGPGRVTGQDVTCEPSNMDLAMKLHYLKGVYYFPKQAFEGMTVMSIKEAAFSWLNEYYVICGRFRRSETGRPYIKCNDCGVRFIEAQCEKTMEEWMEMKEKDGNNSLEKLLVHNQVIGPELPFSPLVLLQLTKFKCGGVSLGLSWAHVLGDAFSAAESMNALGRIMVGRKPGPTLNPPQFEPAVTAKTNPQKPAGDPASLKRVSPVGDHWTTAADCRMQEFSFHVSASALSPLHLKLCFETIAAVIWRCIAGIREGGDEPEVVTVCRRDWESKRDDGVIKNRQIVSVLQAEFSVLKADPSELAAMIKNGGADEREKIGEAMEREDGLWDVIVYGSNLTFVNLEDAELYDFEVKGQKPAVVSYSIGGVGEEGAVLVLPTGPNRGESSGDEGRMVTVILPENQAMELKTELKKVGLFSS